MIAGKLFKRSSQKVFGKQKCSYYETLLKDIAKQNCCLLYSLRENSPLVWPARLPAPPLPYLALIYIYKLDIKPLQYLERNIFWIFSFRASS